MTRINEVPLVTVYLALCWSGGNRAETPSSSQALWATKELAHTGDKHGATQHMAKPFVSFLEQDLTFPAGFGIREMCVHAPGVSVPGMEELRGTVFRELGARLGTMLIFSLRHVAGEGRGVFAMRVGVRRVSPHVMGTGRPCSAAAGPNPSAGMCSVTPGPARSHPVRPLGPLMGASPMSPVQRGSSSTIPLCLQWGMGVLPLPAALPGAGTTTDALPPHSSDLWMFAHSCLLMCLVTKSCQDGALLPPAHAGLLPPFPSRESEPTLCWVGVCTLQRSKTKSPAHTQPVMPLLGATSVPPLDTSEPKMPTEFPGQMAITSPG